MNTMNKQLAAFAAAVALAGPAAALQAGLQQMRVAGATAEAAPITVALYYPTQAAAQAISMGPFAPQVAMGGPPEAAVKGLIVVSHGTGGSEIGHSRLAEALASRGYLVAALRHPGDNWQDVSLLKDHPERYFDERPRQVTRVIDALLADAQWKDRIARDARGPRIGALGHSAGGYTVMALAGGQPDLRRAAQHCATERAEDPLFCSTGGRAPERAAEAARPAVALADPRVRAVVALAPLGVVFTPESLAAIHIPVAVYAAELDRWLVPRFHAEWIGRHVPGVQMHRVPNAWHFAFHDAPSATIPTPDGDLGADPAGFDRKAFIGRLAQEVGDFFDQAW